MIKQNYRSRIAATLCCVVLFLSTTFYYSKWNNIGTEATISWDATGYYTYLPAAFIYHDLKQLDFMHGIIAKYGPVPTMEFAYEPEPGKRVIKYSCGEAVLYSPFFFIAHLVAPLFGYEKDGFSKPYQIAIAYGALMVSFLGIWLLRKLLLRRFKDLTVAVTLLCIVVGTNYLEYASISNSLTHTWLFTIYVLLILATERFYQKPTYVTALSIGALVGICALTRPTEIISAMIPVLWGIGFPLRQSIAERFKFLLRHIPMLMAAGVVTALIGSLQLIYWKYASGHWFVYSYGDQHFSWLHPHTLNGLWSYNNGWLPYTPMMYFALLGLLLLVWRKSRVAVACIAFTLTYIYMAFSWDIWWYGGSLGQRTMIQAYPILSFGLASFVQSAMPMRAIRVVFLMLVAFFIYYNLWLTHQAHYGGKYKTGEMTRAYFWRTFLSNKNNTEDLKLLDTNEYFDGERQTVQRIYTNNFEQDTSHTCSDQPIERQRSICLPPNGFSEEYSIALTKSDAEWIRSNLTFRCSPKEWNTWSMPQFYVRFYNNDKILKDKFIRAYRLMQDGEMKEVFIDSKIPDNATRVTTGVWNPSPDKSTQFDLLRVETFK